MYSQRNAAKFVRGQREGTSTSNPSPIRCFGMFGVDHDYKLIDNYIKKCSRGVFSIMIFSSHKSNFQSKNVD